MRKSMHKLLFYPYSFLKRYLAKDSSKGIVWCYFL